MILLDTNVWLHWVERSRPLSPEQEAAIGAAAAESGEIVVSAVRGWEIGLLVARRRIRLSGSAEAWVARSLASASIRMLPLAWEDAAASTHLPGDFHSDPADCFLVATARRMDLPLLTMDAKIRSYPHVETI